MSGVLILIPYFYPLQCNYFDIVDGVTYNTIGRMGLFCRLEITFSYMPVFSKLLFSLPLKIVSALLNTCQTF